MKTQTEIAQDHLTKLGLFDLTSYTKEQINEFWNKVNAQYLGQYDKHTT